MLANLNSCFEDENLRILDEKLIGNKMLTEKEEYIVSGLGKHMIQKLAGKAQVAPSKCDKPCPCALIEPKGTCPEKAPLSKGLMYIGKYCSLLKRVKCVTCLQACLICWNQNHNAPFLPHLCQLCF